MIDQRSTGALVTSVGSLIALVGTFLPWVRSGTVDRHSYTIFELIDRLGFARGGAIGLAVRSWPVVPLLLVLTAVLQWWAAPARWVRVAVALATAGYVGLTATAIAFAPDAALLRIGAGPVVTAAGCGVIVAGQIVPAFSRADPSATS